MANTIKPRVLYIEDSVNLRDLFKTVIESSCDFDVDTVGTGSEGIDKYRSGNYHAVAIDYQLPDMNGLEVCNRLFADDPDLRVVIITAYGDEAIAAAALNMGVSNYVVKGTSAVYVEILPSVMQQLVKRSIETRKAAETEKALQLSEQRLRGAIESLDVGFALFDASDKLVAMNREYRKINPAAEDYLNKEIHFEDLIRINFRKSKLSDITDDEDEFVHERMALHNNPGEPILRRFNDGTWRMLRETRTPEGGTALTFTDITRLKMAEEAARSSERRYRSTFEHAKIGISNVSLEGQFITVNDYFAEILGYDKDKLLTMSFADVTHPDDLESGLAAVKDMATGKRSSVDDEKRFVRADGATIWVRLTSVPTTDEEGLLEYFTTVIEDITANKKAIELIRESEERYRSTFENTPVGSIVIDPEGRIEVFNSAAEKIFGYAPDEIVGKNVRILMPESFRSAHDSQLKRYVAGGVARFIGRSREVSGRRRNGEEFTMRLGIGEVHIGERRSFIGSVEDLSETKSLEAKLRQSQKMEAVGQLTGGIAHDFNNLLAIVAGNVELLSDAIGNDDENRKIVNRALGAVDRGAALTQQLLAFSRRQSLRPEVININDLIANTINILKRTLGENIKIKSRFFNALPSVRIDPNILENAIINLAINARDAMPGGGELSIETSVVIMNGEVFGVDQRAAHGPHVLLRVGDNGSGISLEDQEHIFEPFFTTKPVGQGSGLGLSMVYGFMVQSNGYMRVDSAIGQGTQIKLYIPCVDEPASQALAPRKSESADFAMNKTILLVEDDPDVRQTTAQSLNRLGFAIIEAEDGPGAVGILKASSSDIDLVFSDIVMPSGMSGVDLAKWVQSHCPKVHVLLTSGYPEKIRDGYSAENHQIPVLAKPYRKNDLISSLRGAFGA